MEAANAHAGSGEPSSPTSHIKILTRTFSQDTTTSSATWYSGAGGGALLPASGEAGEDPPPHFEARLCSLDFALKITQWCLCILCTGLFFEGSALIFEFKKQLFPYITYWTYMMITGVIILSYLLGQKMREMLIRIYNIIGAIMFLIASIIIFNITATEWDNWTLMQLNNTVSTTPIPSKDANPTRTKLAHMLLTQSILCFLNSIIYVLDTAYSLYMSYKIVRLNLEVKCQ